LRRSGVRAVREFAPFGSSRHSAVRAIRQFAPFGSPRHSAVRAIRQFAPFGSPRRSALAPLTHYAAKALRPSGASPLLLFMPQSSSFDVTTGVDLQEVDNAVNQAQKEVAQRYDFKGSNASIEFKRAEEQLLLSAASEFQMNALFDIVQSKLIKRGVPVKNLDVGEIKQAGGDTVRQEIKLKTALDSDTAKKVAAAIKDAKLKKVQASIQGDQVRVTSPSRDDLQDAMALLRKGDFGVELKFGNYR
jgi:cyclic-di-GMP-binding protein